MLTTYLSSPNTQHQAHAARGMPVLLSFGVWNGGGWMERYVSSFDRVLVDSGAFSVLSSGKVIDLGAYAEFSKRMLQLPNVDAAACLDDIDGDWKKGLDNWDKAPWTFACYHDTDPENALDEILDRLQDHSRPQWIGLGMKPPRKSRGWLIKTLRKIEHRSPHIHIHGFAMRSFLDILLEYNGRSLSVDSTNWLLDVRKLLDCSLTKHLTPAEALDIVVKRYQRDKRKHTGRDDRQKELQL